MTRSETLARAVGSSQELFLRFLAGFDETNRTTQAEHLPNHAAWTLGHCALVMHRIAERLDGRPIPESDFTTGDGGSTQRFDTETVAFGSRPTDEPDRYPTLERGRSIFTAAVGRLRHAVGAARDAQLDEQVPWGRGGTIVLGDLVLRAAFHNGTHAGQLVDLRRALGLAPVI